MGDKWICSRCKDKKCKLNFDKYHFNEQPEFIKSAKQLELNLCSLNMVNAYNFQLGRGPKNKAEKNNKHKKYMQEKRKDPDFLKKEQERDEIRRKNAKIQKQMNSMSNLPDQEYDAGFTKD